MYIWKHKETGKNYMLEHLILDIRFTNRNAFAGIYAYPYGHTSEVLQCVTKDQNQIKEFILQFEPIAFI